RRCRARSPGASWPMPSTARVRARPTPPTPGSWVMPPVELLSALCLGVGRGDGEEQFRWYVQVDVMHPVGVGALGLREDDADLVPVMLQPLELELRGGVELAVHVVAQSNRFALFAHARCLHSSNFCLFGRTNRNPWLNPKDLGWRGLCRVCFLRCAHVISESPTSTWSCRAARASTVSRPSPLGFPFASVSGRRSRSYALRERCSAARSQRTIRGWSKEISRSVDDGEVLF